MHIESLESRSLCNAYITGGPGHAGIAVDVHDENGKVVGNLCVDFYASGYFGETPGTDGQSSGNVITGDQGRFLYTYNPTPFRVTGQTVIPGNAVDDARLAEYIRRLGGPNAATLAMLNQYLSCRVDANSDFATYTVGSNNCFSFVGACINAELDRYVYDRNGYWPITYTTLIDGWNRWNRGKLSLFLSGQRLPADTDRHYLGDIRPEDTIKP